METAQGSFERISSLMKQIENLHRSALLTVQIEDSISIAKKIEAASMLASAEASNIRRLLKSMAADTKRDQDTLSSSDFRLRTSKHRSLCKKFLAMMDEFETMQATYRNKYRAQLERQYMLIKPDASRAELDELHGSHSSQMMTQQVSQGN